SKGGPNRRKPGGEGGHGQPRRRTIRNVPRDSRQPERGRDEGGGRRASPCIARGAEAEDQDGNAPALDDNGGSGEPEQSRARIQQRVEERRRTGSGPDER